MTRKKNKEKAFGLSQDLVIGVVGAFTLLVSLSTYGQEIGRAVGASYDRMIHSFVYSLEISSLSILDRPGMVESANKSFSRRADTRGSYRSVGLFDALESLQALFRGGVSVAAFVAPPVRDTVVAYGVNSIAAPQEDVVVFTPIAPIAEEQFVPALSGATSDFVSVPQYDDVNAEAKEILMLLNEIEATVELLAAVDG